MDAPKCEVVRGCPNDGQMRLHGEKWICAMHRQRLHRTGKLGTAKPLEIAEPKSKDEIRKALKSAARLAEIRATFGLRFVLSSRHGFYVLGRPGARVADEEVGSKLVTSWRQRGWIEVEPSDGERFPLAKITEKGRAWIARAKKVEAA